MNRIHRLLRKPFFGRFEVPWIWPTGAVETRWERVCFQSGNGASLVGLWGSASDEAAGTLVLAHPMGKAAKGFWLRYGHADLFRQSGFNVLVFDFNGFGESEAVSFDYPADVLAAGLWARGRSSLPVGLVGASFGAGWGLCSMSHSESRFCVAVLEAVFPNLPEFWRHYPIAYTVLRISQYIWPSLERKLRPEREAARIVGHPSVLLVYGGADEYTPPKFGARLLRSLGNAAARSELFVVPRAGHTFAYRDSPEAYTQRVIPFIIGALQGEITRPSSALALTSSKNQGGD